MNELTIVPKVLRFETVKEYMEEFSFNEEDLIITNRFIFEPFFNVENTKAELLYQEDFGHGEPSDVMVEEMYASIARRPKRVIAIGGGTVIDIAKLFALKNVLPVEDLFDHKLEFIKDKELIIIPTTCGTGSEITKISILNLTKKNTKKGLVVDELFADQAVLIPELLKTLPFEFFGTSSVDALIHAVESVLSPLASTTTKVFGYKAIELIINGYVGIKEYGPEKRFDLLDDFLIASLYAGISFGNAGTGAIHALSYPLGAAYHVAHGEANYAIFMGVMNKYLSIKDDGEINVLNQFIANLINCEVIDVYQKLEELMTAIIRRKPLKEYGVTTNDLDTFTDSVIENQQRLLKNNFTCLAREDIFDIYKELY